MPNLPQELIWADHYAERVPPIAEQTPFRTGFFRFGPFEQGRRMFNCGLFRDFRGDWLITRVAEEDPICAWGRNSLWAFHLDGSHNPQRGFKIQMPSNYRNQHWEDPRCTILPNGAPLVSYTTFVMDSLTSWYGAHQQAALLNEDFQPVQIFDPIFGKNGGSVIANGLEANGTPRNEKNWLWFYHGGKAHCVYMTQPHEVVEFHDGMMEPKQIHKTDGPDERRWRFGHPRGGTPPVRVGDEYWSFFHSSTPWRENAVRKNRYHMGAYAFDAKPPFRITRFTRFPILTGSPKDPWATNQPLVVFPCGALLKDGTWLVSMGVNDMASAWIEVPHAELEKLTPPYASEETKPEDDPADAVTELDGGASPDSDGVAAEPAACGVGGESVRERAGEDGVGASEGLPPKPRRPTRRRIRRRRSKGLRGDLRIRASAPAIADAG